MIRIQPVSMVVCAATVTAIAVVLTASSASTSRVSAVSVSAANCNTPNYAGKRMLREPPMKDLTGLGPVVPGELQMHVVRNGTHYCYFLGDDTSAYVEAPTIRIRKDQTFTLRLIDEIEPTPAPTPGSAQDSTADAMPMAGATMSPDGCAIMDFEAPLPAPSPAGYLGKKRIFHGTPSMPSTATNVHTHGFHVDPNVDNVFKELTNATGHGATRECVYKFHLYESQYVGTYWYHSHMHGIAQAQVGGGLAGTIIVDPAKPVPMLPEHVVLVKDYQPPAFSETNRVEQARLSAAEGNPGRNLAPRAVASFDPQHPPSWLSGQPITTVERCPTAGRLNHWTVNGYPVADPQIAMQPKPVPPATPNPGLPLLLAPPLSIVHPNQEMLYRVVNATSESFVNLRLLDADGDVEAMHVVGRDGVPVDGMNTNPEAQYVVRQNVLLPPGGRADVVIKGQTRPQLLISDLVCSGYLGDWIPRRNLVEIAPSTNVPDPTATATPAVFGNRAPAASPLRATRGASAADRFLAAYPHPAVQRALTFTQYDQAFPDFGSFYIFETTGGASKFSEQPFWLSRPPAGSKPLPHEHFLPNVVAHTGTTEEWTLVNATGEVHAFHIHQLTFVTEYNPLEGGDVHVFQDVVTIPSAIMDPSKPQNGNFPWLKPQMVKIRMDFTHAQRGVYVYHCHMLFHEDRGMMGIIQVV